MSCIPCGGKGRLRLIDQGKDTGEYVDCWACGGKNSDWERMKKNFLIILLKLAVALTCYALLWCWLGFKVALTLWLLQTAYTYPLIKRNDIS